MEFVWKNYVGKPTLEIFESINNMLDEEEQHTSQFQDRILFMSMYEWY